MNKYLFIFSLIFFLPFIIIGFFIGPFIYFFNLGVFLSKEMIISIQNEHK